VGHGITIPCDTSPRLVNLSHDNFNIDSLISLIIYSLYAIIQVCREKKLSTIRVLGRIFGPILITSGLITLWLTTSTSIVFKDEHFILFSIFVGFLFGEMTSDIILAHLTKSEFPHFRDIYYALFVMVVIEKWNYYLPR
jgi:ethanolaminephosphotransferase